MPEGTRAGNRRVPGGRERYWKVKNLIALGLGREAVACGRARVRSTRPPMMARRPYGMAGTAYGEPTKVSGWRQ